MRGVNLLFIVALVLHLNKAELTITPVLFYDEVVGPVSSRVRNVNFYTYVPYGYFIDPSLSWTVVPPSSAAGFTYSITNTATTPNQCVLQVDDPDQPNCVQSWTLNISPADHAVNTGNWKFYFPGACDFKNSTGAYNPAECTSSTSLPTYSNSQFSFDLNGLTDAAPTPYTLSPSTDTGLTLYKDSAFSTVPTSPFIVNTVVYGLFKVSVPEVTLNNVVFGTITITDDTNTVFTLYNNGAITSQGNAVALKVSDGTGRLSSGAYGDVSFSLTVARSQNGPFVQIGDGSQSARSYTLTVSLKLQYNGISKRDSMGNDIGMTESQSFKVIFD
eukprot:TRINITY_DN407_c0_g1_i4.p1 TRINITY_DN407_c0_g1~~TRINITY_DN407_c0_g1_i4.p1  ORF type:complete len:330 (-),score=80.10 TRINITY_DN407_c0_g1_i4:80-1069(-)